MSASWYLITRVQTEKGVLVEEGENNNPKWTLATMEKYMRDEDDTSLALGLVPRHPINGSSNRQYPNSFRQQNSKLSEQDANLCEDFNGDHLESAGEESSPSWASSSAGNTPSYSSGGTAFEFGQKTEDIELLKNNAPVITTTKCTPTSTPVNDRSKKNWQFDPEQQLCPDLRSDFLAALEPEDMNNHTTESKGSLDRSKRKSRKGSADDIKNSEQLLGTPIKSASRLSRLLRRTHSAGCSKDGPVQKFDAREKPPVTKTKSADAAPCSREDEDAKRRNRKTLAQDMKMRLSFFRRRHTDSSLQTSVRPPPEEAQKWAKSFNELTNNKYGLSLFRAFLSREFSEENIEFWLACEEFKRSRPNKLSSKARKIYDDFVAVQSPKEVNLDSIMRSDILEHLQHPDRNAFDSAQRRIQGLMEQDAYLRFLQSDLYTDLIQCDQESTS